MSLSGALSGEIIKCAFMLDLVTAITNSRTVPKNVEVGLPLVIAVFLVGNVDT